MLIQKEVEIPIEFAEKQQILEKIAGQKSKEEKWTKRYKEIKFYELKKLNKELKKLGPEIQAKEQNLIDQKISYIKVKLVEFSSGRKIYFNFN